MEKKISSALEIAVNVASAQANNVACNYENIQNPKLSMDDVEGRYFGTGCKGKWDSYSTPFVIIKDHA